MSLRILLALTFLAPSTALAQRPVEVPTFEARVRSVNDLLGHAEYLATATGKEDAVKQARGLLATLADEKQGLEGLDLHKPFGAYAFLKPDVVDSPFVILIPVADEARALRMLKDRIGYAGEPKDGVHSIPIPRTNESVHFRFADGYAHVSLRRDSLEPTSLLKPATFFANDDGSVASATLRLDRVPTELKTFLFGQLELRIHDARARTVESPAQQKWNEFLLDAGLAFTKCVLEDGKDLTLRFRIEPKSDDITFETTLVPKPDTLLAKSLVAAAPKESRTAAIASVGPTTIGFSMNAVIPPGYRDRYVTAVEGLGKELIASTPEQSRQFATQLADAILPTLKAGTFETAIAFLGASPKHPGAIAALRVKDSKPLMQLVRSLSILVPVSLAKFEFDRETIHGVALHRIELPALPREQTETLGSRVLWIAEAKELLAVSVEDDGASLQRALGAKPVPAPMLDVSLALARLAPLAAGSLPTGDVKALVTQVFGQEVALGSDTMRATLTGGESLHLKFALKGKALKLAILLDEAKKK